MFHSFPPMLLKTGEAVSCWVVAWAERFAQGSTAVVPRQRQGRSRGCTPNVLVLSTWMRQFQAPRRCPPVVDGSTIWPRLFGWRSSGFGNPGSSRAGISFGSSDVPTLRTPAMVATGCLGQSPSTGHVVKSPLRACWDPRGVPGVPVLGGARRLRLFVGPPPLTGEDGQGAAQHLGHALTRWPGGRMVLCWYYAGIMVVEWWYNGGRMEYWYAKHGKSPWPMAEGLN